MEGFGGRTDDAVAERDRHPHIRACEGVDDGGEHRAGISGVCADPFSDFGDSRRDGDRATTYPPGEGMGLCRCVFELTGVFISHMAHGSAVVHHFCAGSFAACVVASWALHPASREPSVPVFRRYGQVTWVDEAQRDTVAA
jgi:hypothetical protein